MNAPRPLAAPGIAPCGCIECPRHYEQRVERAEMAHFIALREEDEAEEVFDSFALRAAAAKGAKA